jgi:hypothetical protein
MRKFANLLVFIILGISFFPSLTLAAPQPSGNWSNTTTIYNPLVLSSFQVEWSSDDSNGYNFSWFSTNCTNDNSWRNYTTGRIDNISYISITLPACSNAGWKFYANDSSDSWSTTDEWNFNINKVPTEIRLFLDGNESNGIYNLNYPNANFTASLSVLGKNVTLTSNMTGFGTLNNITPVTQIINLNYSGLFYLNASFDGDQNYSANFSAHYFNVTSWSKSTTLPSLPTTYSSDRSYQFNITWQNKTPIYNVYFVWNDVRESPTGNRTIDNNTTEFYLIRTDLAANQTGYSYHLYVNDTNGNISLSDQWNYVINPFPVTLSWASPDSSGLWSSTVGSSVTVVCSSAPAINLTIYFYELNTYYHSTTLGLVSVSGISPSSPTTYYFSCYPQDSNNYSTGTLFGTLSFTQSSSNPNQGSGYTPPSTFTFAIQSLPSKVSVNAGESETASFNIRNTYQFNMTVSTTLKNISSNWYSLSRNDIAVKSNGTEPITITFNVPANAEVKNYTVKVNITGKSSGGIIKTAETTMTLNVNPSQIVPQQTNITNETETEETANVTTTVEGETNQTAGPTGLMPIRPEDFRNIVLFFGIIAIGLIFIFRDKITYTFTRGRSGKGNLPKISVPKVEVRSKLHKISKLRLRINLIRKRKNK